MYFYNVIFKFCPYLNVRCRCILVPKKSSPNRGSPLNSSIDKTKFTEMTNGKLQFTFCFPNSTIVYRYHEFHNFFLAFVKMINFELVQVTWNHNWHHFNYKKYRKGDLNFDSL